MLKVLIVAVLTALFGIFGFIGLHYNDFDLILGCSVVVAIIALSVAICFLVLEFNKELDKLEKL